jgi:N-methylhydantoinase B/oxoprolinase/acetone carboxylase alpha subunit
MLRCPRGEWRVAIPHRARPDDSSNGEVAQRVADIVFTAFNVMSGSHGSMNGTHLIYKKYTWAETSERFRVLGLSPR